MTAHPPHRRSLLRALAPLALPTILFVLIGATLVRFAPVAYAQSPAGTPAAATPSVTTESRGIRVSLAEVFFIQRHPETREIELVGSLIIWLLLALSVISMGLAGAYYADNRTNSIAPPEEIARARALLKDRRVDELIDFLRVDRSHFAHVMFAALEQRGHGWISMLRAAEQAADENALTRLRRIEPLNIIGNVAPMIGLFGTVYGMILAFREIVAAGGTPDPVQLAAGIGTALVTTFWGLIVAIPGVSIYALLRNRIDELTARSAREADALLDTFRPATTTTS